MAESAVSSVLGRLGNLAIQETSLLCKVTGEVGFLKNELERLQEFLHDADSKRRSGNKNMAVWVHQIRGAAYDAENVIEVAEHVKKRNRLKKGFMGAISRYARLPSDLVTLHKVDAEIRRIRRNIQEITRSVSNLGIHNLGGSTVPEVLRDEPDPLYRPIFGDDDDVVVGFQKEAEKIVEELKNMENKQLTVISIVATGGAGKTTLARKVYDSAAVRECFNAFAFVSISQKFEVLRVLKDITMQAMGIIEREDKELGKTAILEKLEKMRVEEITAKLCDLLKGKRYLIVLDDVWTTDTWDGIKQAFPDIKNGSRVLLTTRNLQAANQANKLTHVHQLRLLNEEESWQLFCSKAFPSYESIDTNHRGELERVGKSLVKKCDGLPLALVVLGGHLAKNLHREAWLRMDTCLDWEVMSRWDIMQSIIARSYDDMSDHRLKSCFLFVASFPEDWIIQADCLIRAWVAEGFVQHKGRNSIELLNEDGLWQSMLKKKYLKNKTLSQVVKQPGDSHFWSGLLEVKDLVLARSSFKVNNGQQSRFWEDIWVGKEALMRRFPNLYRIVRKKNVTVAQVLSTTPLNVSFRRALVGDNRTEWCKLVSWIGQVSLNEQEDVLVWDLHKRGSFSVHSLYRDLMVRESRLEKNFFWKAKIPLKIKVFLWFVKKGVILTKDNLAKKQWQGSTNCCFCPSIESIQHLFFDCRVARAFWNVILISFGVQPPSNVGMLFGSWLRNFSLKLRNQILVGIAAVCWTLWLNRNDAVFKRANTHSFVQVIFRGTYWIRSWSHLSKEEARRALINGCKRLEWVVLKLFSKFGWNISLRLKD